MTSVAPKIPILSTAGAIPVKNEKGELTMEKVKVSRYVTGKRPEYAPVSSDEEEEEEEYDEKEITKEDDEEEENKREEEEDTENAIPIHMVQHDRRLKRLMEAKAGIENKEDRISSHRRLVEAELLEGSEEDEEEEEEEEEDQKVEGDVSDTEELDDEEIERRREAIRNRLRSQKKDEEILKREEEAKENEKGEDEEDDEEEEYTDDDEEEEEEGARMKPVFVRKKDRLTLHEREVEEKKLMNQEHETKKKATERRLQTLKLVDSAIKKDLAREQAEEEVDDFQGVRSDGENEAEEFEAWKVRNLKYIKRDRDEKEAAYKEKMELERLRNMTEEERRIENKLNPKVITNKMEKGKYKFLQKYYHRGAFYLDEEDQVYKRDFTAPTLEDHFNKTILPKVMQVKNFGRSGRTKYTHLVDQDTTKFEAAWVTDTAMNLKFHSSKGGGMKQVFEKPSAKRKKVE